MCFSTTASFASFTILTTVGVAGLKYIKKPSQQFFAAIPFLFATQQLIEGFVWIGVLNNAAWKTIPIHLFIFFAQVVWAFWVPYSILRMETQMKRNHKGEEDTEHFKQELAYIQNVYRQIVTGEIPYYTTYTIEAESYELE